MIPDEMAAFFAGVTACGFLLVATFFLRFWRRSGERLFAAFGGAFALLALGQAIPVIFGIDREEQPAVYLFRLAAFGLIIMAVLAKNLRSRRRDRHDRRLG